MRRGEGDLATRRALEELEPGYHIDWYVYGLVGNQFKVERQHVDGTR
jgi:hypothetical protein